MVLAMRTLSRTGNIFRDTLQNGLALNQIFEALNVNSKTIKNFHPGQQTFQPNDYAKEAGRVFGSVLVGDGLKSAENGTFYSKVIESIQQKYPNLQECCIIGWAALAITSLGTFIAIIACCVSLCCECGRGQCTPCCRMKSIGDTCGSICGCAGAGGEVSDAAFQPVGQAQDYPHIPPHRRAGSSAQRDGTAAAVPLVTRGVKDYSIPNWQVFPGQEQSHL